MRTGNKICLYGRKGSKYDAPIILKPSSPYICCSLLRAKNTGLGFIKMNGK